MPKLSDLSPYHKRLIKKLRHKIATEENTKLAFRDLYWRFDGALSRVRRAVEDGEYTQATAIIDEAKAAEEARWEAHDIASKEINRKFRKRKADGV